MTTRIVILPVVDAQHGSSRHPFPIWPMKAQLQGIEILCERLVRVSAKNSVHRSSVTVVRGEALHGHVDVGARDTVIRPSVAVVVQAVLSASPGVGPHHSVLGTSVAVQCSLSTLFIMVNYTSSKQKSTGNTMNR